MLSHDGVLVWAVLAIFVAVFAIASKHVKGIAVWREAGYVLIAAGCAMGLVFLYLFFLYLGASPHAPQVIAGNVVPLYNHGSVVFITKQQDLVLTLLQIGGVITRATGGLLAKHGRSPRNGLRR